jgi:glycine cleavage system H protein
MSYPADLKYAESHEWVRIEGDVATVGISWFAQDSMGDVVHVELAEVGSDLSKGTPACEIESVKAVSDVYAPVSGEVIEVNEGLEDTPESVNEDPYGGGWLFKVRLAGTVEGMMDAAAYQAHCEA